MNSDPYFLTQKPKDQFLSSIIDYYFFIDIPVEQLTLSEEYIIPFPRITFGYFFDHPFMAQNLTQNQSTEVNMAISRISTDKIVVRPLTDHVKIIGAHVRPFCLAYLSKTPVNKLPWIIQTPLLFPETADTFRKHINECSESMEMFDLVEQAFLENVNHRDLSLITNGVELIEKNSGEIKVGDLSDELSVTERTIRNQFYRHIGCSPKEFIRLVKLKQVAFQIKNSSQSLTNITYDNEYFDQSHFIHEVKKITGKSPNKLRKEISDFRFLQF